MNPQQPMPGLQTLSGRFLPIGTEFSQPPQAFSPKVDINALRDAIKNNETGIVKSDPYLWHQPSGVKKIGNANGAYNVTDAELASYALKYLGRKVNAETFLNNRALQDQYMNAKIKSLADRGLTAEQIMASHRGGLSDLTPAGLENKIKIYQDYVNKGMKIYMKNANTQRTLADLQNMGGLSMIK